MEQGQKKVSEMPDDVFNACLKAAFEQGDTKTKLSKEEQDNFAKAMLKPEFTKLMKEYMDEISDPKNRAEQEAYLKQLEDENKVPTNMRLVRPKAGFCVKVQRLEGPKLETKGKLFINVCSAEEVEMAAPKRVNNGISWSLPYSLGPMRHENDKKKDVHPTFDFAMHPGTLGKCAKDGRFQKMVIDTAVEAIEARIAQVLPGTVKLEKSSARVLRGVKCIGGTPAVMQMPRQPGDEEAKPIAIEKENYKQIADGIAVPKNAQAPNPLIEEAEPKPAKPVNEPNYKIVHRGHLDLSDFVESGYEIAPRASKRPKELVIKIQVPKIKSAKYLDIETSEYTLKLVSNDKSVADYELSLNLPYPVDEENGSAKFDKEKRILEVVLPVKLPPREEVLLKKYVEDDIDNSSREQTEPVHEVSDNRNESETNSTILSDTESKYGKVKADSHQRWVESVSASTPTDESIEPKPETHVEDTDEAVPVQLEDGTNELESILAAALAASKLPLPKAEDLLPKEEQKSEDPIVQKESNQAHEEVKVSSVESFIACSSFNGAKEGFVFKNDTLGLGYYCDDKKPTIALQSTNPPRKNTDENIERDENSLTENTTGIVPEKASRFALRNKEIFELD